MKVPLSNAERQARHRERQRERILGFAFVVPPIVLLFAGTALMVGTIGATLIWLLSIVLALSIVAGVARLLEAPAQW